ncbi:signal peptidase complex catalytic subunit SEC11C [Nephila pilipes]|uniref:Signal peptidase complex catalytic subunit SEC11 n=1 Tax=Nephila pilipes TaxID=299642 RepID=A0A8X6MU36_NEPPI|nr:signal peptidase complex catalytic subunit SEC11C [Nephila pilipes]
MRPPFLNSLLKFGLLVGSVCSLWYGFTVVTGCRQPLTVVMTEGMEPALRKGDIVYSTNYEEDSLNVGDIIIFDVQGRGRSIVHRITYIQTKQDGTLQMLTKGDGRPLDDRALFYPPGQMWVEKKDVIGKVKGVVPPIGIVILLFQEYQITVYGGLIVYFIVTVLISKARDDFHHHLHH